MRRTQIINSLIEKIKAKSYLEIGVDKAINFNNIICNYKVGVDPNPKSFASHKISSDDFFDSNSERFDVVFIDGLHHASQVYKDIVNSLMILNDPGYIVCHDMLPPSEEYQIIPPVQDLWTGDCWKAWIKIRQDYDSLIMHTVDTDFGCGIISKGCKQETINVPSKELGWSDFVNHKKEWMNIINVEKFKDIYLTEEK